MLVEVRSTSVITAECKRYALEVLQASAPARRGKITHAGVFNCRKISGSDTFSQHAFGNAIDLFCAEADLAAIARNVVLQATRLTRANEGLLVQVATIIHHTLAWTTSHPEFHEANVNPHLNHVHVEFLPTLKGIPPCAS